MYNLKKNVMRKKNKIKKFLLDLIYTKLMYKNCSLRLHQSDLNVDHKVYVETKLWNIIV